jgi:hypothetical protein
VAVDTRKLPILPAFLFALGALYFGWQLWGLRYTNHDDIVFNLYASAFSENKLAFASYIAHEQARLQAYINMPILLAVEALVDSGLYDVLNIGSILACYGGLIYLLSTVAPVRDAVSLVAVAFLLFPLHYYYSFPQGYPVMACWGFCLALFSAGLFGSYLRDASKWKRATSVFFFSISLWGSEYNFALHPILVCVPLLAMGLQRGTGLVKASLPYLLVWATSLLIYAAYSFGMHSIGADLEGRVVPSFNFVAWLDTFLILQEKVFLPLSLWRGIQLFAATSQGVPDIPRLLTFASIAKGIPDRGSVLIVLLSTWLFCGLALYSQRLSKKAICVSAFTFLSFLLIPCGVLAGSSHYQEIVLAGYLQGHLSTFYSQLGMTGLIVLALSAMCNAWKTQCQRTVVVGICALMLAGTATITFVYNNLNRQVMSANVQKWAAMRDLVQFVEAQRPDLEKRIFNAPAFWTVSGVSDIPALDPFLGENYWTTYSRIVLKSDLRFSNASEQTPGAVQVAYFATPVGIPVVAVYEQQANNSADVVTIVSSRAVSGTLLFQFEDGTPAKEDVEHWVCNEMCTMQWRYDRAIQSRSISFYASDRGPVRLLTQFFLGRGGEFGMPLKRRQGDLL